MFYLNSTLNFGIPPVMVFQGDVYYMVDRLLTGLAAQQKGATAQWYSNKTSICTSHFPFGQLMLNLSIPALSLEIISR